VDINEIGAGTYELRAERWDQRTSKPGEPFTFRRWRRGDKVDLDEATARRLVTAGAAVKPGTLEREAAERARLAYEAALAMLPKPDDESGVEDGEDDGQGSDPDGPERPATVEAKGVWVDHAVARGLDRDEVSKLSKAEIIAAVDRLDAPTD